MRLGSDVDPAAVRRFREARGLTHEALAELAWASPLEVAAWEDGTVHVPREQARRLRRRDVADRRAAAVAAAALPACAWADVHAPDLHAVLLATPGVLDRLSSRALSHLDGCPACGRVRAFGAGLLRLGPDPGLGTDVLESLEHWYDTAPRLVLYSIVFGGGTALAVGGAYLWQHLPRLPYGRVWDGAAAVLSGAMAFGASATVLRRLLRRRPYLAGALATGVAVLAGAAVWMLSEPGVRGFSGTALLCLLLVAVAAGVLAARWNDRNPWDPAAGTGRADAGRARLAPPDPLAQAVAAPDDTPGEAARVAAVRGGAKAGRYEH